MDKQYIIDKITQHIGACTIEVSGENCSFGVHVTSPAFIGKSTIECHRLINDAVREDINNGSLHALSIRTVAAEL